MFRNFMMGRYGMDRLSITLIIIGLLLSGSGYQPVWILALVLICWSIYRSLSKNYAKRYMELEHFNRMAVRARSVAWPLFYRMSGSLRTISVKINQYRARRQEKKYYRFVKCPNCKKTLRLPRGKGKLHVTCPVCKTEFFKKS